MSVIEKASDLWQTPPEYFAWMSHRFGPFDIDLFANQKNHLCPAYFTIEDNAFDQDWGRVLRGLPARCFANPPYSAPNLPRFARKALDTVRATPGSLVAGLFPASTGERWWQHFVLRASQIIFVSGRIPFLRPDGTVGKENRYSHTIVVWENQPCWHEPKPIWIDRDMIQLEGTRLLSQQNVQLSRQTA